MNNAGYGLSGKFENYSIHDYANNMQVNMSVPVELCHAFLPDFHKLPRAYILNICSTAAFQAVPGLSVYAASKSFLLSFSRALNYELRKTRISVTAVSPGTTDTDFANRANVGAKALKAGKKMNMKPGVVARMAVTAMFKGKTEITTGFMNKLGGFLAWLFPKRIAENIGGNIYEV